MKGKLNLVFIALLIFQLVAGGIAMPMQTSADETNNDENVSINAENENVNGNKDNNVTDNGNEEENENNNEEENLNENEVENTEENTTEEANENANSTDNEEVKVKSQKSTQTKSDISPQAEVGDDYFEFTISEIKDIEGNAYTEDNPYKPGYEFWVGVKWKLLNGHSYKGGDYVTFDLPEELALLDGSSGDLKNELGDTVATYDISQDGKVTISFTDFVEDNSEVDGWLDIKAQLNEDVVEEKNGEVVIGPIEDEGNQRLPIDRTPIDKTVEKKGTPNKGYNADEIEWEVTINKNANSLTDVVLEDVLPEGTEYVDGSLEAVKQRATINGTPVGDKEDVSVSAESTDPLTINLGNIEEVYTIKYTTKITEEGMDLTEFKNKVTFKDGELDDTQADATVNINRGEPIAKSERSKYDPKTGVLGWELDFNFNQKSLSNETLSDSWAGSEAEGKLELDPNSVKFIEIDIDEEGNATEGDAKTPSEIGANLDVKENGFDITGITTDKPYRVVYDVKVKDRELDGFRILNEAGFADYTTGEIGYNIGQYVGVKSVGDINYAEKTIPWTIKVNMDERQMNDIEISDTLGDGLTLIKDSVKVTIDGEAYTDFELDGDNPFTITEIGSTDKEVVVTYETNYDPNELPEDYKANNKADISWIPDNDSERIKRSVKTNTQVNEATINGSWKNASYDPDNKEITWTIIANYRENEYADFKIVDEPQGNQKLLSDTIEVKELTIEANGDTTDGDTVDVDPAVSGNEFTLDIGETDKAYKVTYKTSLADLEDISKEYENKATVLDGDEEIANLGAKVAVYGDRKYGGKSGNQDGNKVDWSIDVNLAQEKIAGLQLEDSISDNQEYLEDTITVYNAKLKSDGTLEKTDAVSSDDYTLDVAEDSFTLKWNDTIDRPYIIEYSTLFFAGDGEEVSNNYKISGDGIDETSDDASDSSSVTISQTSSGGAQGTAGYLVIQKLDTTFGEDNATPLEGIEFELIDINTGNVLKTVTTDDDGYADFGRLLYGNYKLKEVNVPDGYEAPDQETTITIDKEYTSDSEPLDYVQTIENYREIETVEIPVKKVWNGEATDKVTVKLLADGEEIDSVDLSEDNDWEHTFVKPKFDEEDDSKIEYTIEEVSIDGYDVDITGDADEGFTVTNTELTEVNVEKVWEDKDNKHKVRPDSITVDLLADGEVTGESVELSEAKDWQDTFTELEKYDSEGKRIDYTVEEIEGPHYETEITGSQKDGYTITNSIKDYAIGDYVWVDRNKDGIQDENEEPLEGVKVELYDENGDKIAETETDKNGRYIFDELLAGKYQVKFELTEEQEERYRFTKEQAAGDDTTVDSDADEETGWTRDIVLNDDNEYLTTDYDRDFNATEGIDPTWDAGVIELVQIPIEKVWKDNDNAEETRPEAITVTLFADGEVETSEELSEENGWAHIFKGLDQYDENGEPIEYTVEESDVPEGYVSEVEETEDGFVITNTLQKSILPITPVTKVDVEKVWEGKALDEVIIELFANGEKIDEITLSDDTNWKHTFNGLPKYSDEDFENLIEYTVDEVDVDGYEKEITGDAEEGFVVTNTEIPEDPEDPEKPSDDAKEDEDGDKLPKTATNIYNLLAIGLGVIALSLVVLLATRRKRA